MCRGSSCRLSSHFLAVRTSFCFLYSNVFDGLVFFKFLYVVVVVVVVVVFLETCNIDSRGCHTKMYENTKVN
jgi:hypothetical protein